MTQFGEVKRAAVCGADALRGTPILVLGGTGHFGRQIVHSLVHAGEPVRVLSRDPANARRVLGEGPEIASGDITARGSVVEALRGAGALVVSVSAFTPRLIRKERLIERDAVLMALQEAKKAGVTRVVYISVYEIRQDLLEELGLDLESARIKLEIEATLAGSDFDWTVLGAAPSMQLFFALIRGTTLAVPGGGPPALPTISSKDVGEIAAQTVARCDLAGKRIRMTGPEALSFSEAARRISRATGKNVTYKKIPLFPLAAASILASPFTPYPRQLVEYVRLMNHFPQDLAARVPEDHRFLLETFTYTPTTLEMEALAWSNSLR